MSEDTDPPFFLDPKFTATDIAAYQRRKAEEPFRPNGHDRTPPSNIVSSLDFVAGFKPPDYVLDGILQRGFCYSLTALTGSGKTAVTLLIMAHIAQGRALAGREVQRGAVLMLAGENADDVRMRWIALAEQAGFDSTEIEAYFMPGVFNLRDSFEDIHIQAERAGGFAFVSVDTSAAYFSGEDENSNKELGDHARLLREITKIPGNPCVLANCHPVKNASNDNLLPRGGGAFLNEIDGNLVCTKTDSVVELGWQGKFRGPEFDPISFELSTVTSPRLVDSRGKSVPTVVARTITQYEHEAKDETRDRDLRTLLKLLSGDPAASTAKLAESAGWLMRDGRAYKMKAHRLLYELKADGLVIRRLNRWELSGNGQKVMEKEP